MKVITLLIISMALLQTSLADGSTGGIQDLDKCTKDKDCDSYSEVFGTKVVCAEVKMYVDDSMVSDRKECQEEQFCDTEVTS
mmetsp:Transcript_4495/g.6746  ORF Transcript_4495/g.6746 Transcript_4495/m.6746 type:complete len:82 (-) Transcript_4495:176-421(-)|eukprot:CAMPEP_0170491260 /NCGR_PEP_ID=MMETSP0208-20121228/10684_1 /TAXON_ID=197538 /ORGANISM="Strombidium inclinatum, Strain S3" /LENGTH=81 /DNA_ID=CAMNT_0010766807 /DNA_START=7 /DNA_END=252 /DNA_ORIENTATION=+